MSFLDEGLAKQAALSLAVEMNQSSLFIDQWEMCRPWCEITSPEFVLRVEAQLDYMKVEGANVYHPAHKVHDTSLVSSQGTCPTLLTATSHSRGR